jgi:dienelactone hydrolase
MTFKALGYLFVLVASLSPLTTAAADSAAAATRARDLDTPWSFPEISSAAEWRGRAKQIREQALVSCGLWPMPERTPLNAKVFGRIERDGYTVEKVYLETVPGFYLAGNLYRPLGRGKGPFPGVLNPHGHWRMGRMADEADGSIAGRCINFARQGMVAFSYDMVGYNDTRLADYPPVDAEGFYLQHRRFATNEVNLLWNISLMGLQTWNSIRALDFLESLPDVDPKRLACTGESGGGTQTFMLGAIDDRLAAQAPVVMVSHSMQGGCLCENAPGLRVRHSNMEIAASVAPRPQILVGATGDWTRTTLTLEGPAVAKIYELLKARDRISFVRYDFNHNYNQTSREAVYGWFGAWLLGKSNSGPIAEIPFTKEPDEALRVFPDSRLPEGAISEKQLIERWKDRVRDRLNAMAPTDRKSLRRYQDVMKPGWRHTLQIASPLIPEPERALQLRGVAPSTKSKTKTVVVLAMSEQDFASTWEPFAKACSDAGLEVTAITAYSPTKDADSFANFYYVYNRTKAQERVSDIVAACNTARAKHPGSKVVLCGLGAAGPWALLAAPAADATAADCQAIDVSDDQALLSKDLFCPGFRAIGAFEGVGMLHAPNPLLLHNTGQHFPTDAITQAYKAAGNKRDLRLEQGPLSEEDLVGWLLKVR